MGVSGRSAIAIHPGNTPHHTQGCILVGQFPDKLKGPDRHIKNSANMFKKLMDNLNSSTIYLSIKEDY